MSDSERPDIAAFGELEQLIHALGDEMAAWRRRAHEAEARLGKAEARLKEVGERGAVESPVSPDGAASPRMAELERENQELRQRLEAARERTKQLLERLRFLRQQHEMEAER